MFSPDNLHQFVSAYQQAWSDAWSGSRRETPRHASAPLELQELWAIRFMLRLVLLETTERAVVRMIHDHPPTSGPIRLGATDRYRTTSRPSVRECISSLRALETTDWKDFVELQSVMEQILRSDPAGAYRRMDFASRQQYRDAVARTFYRLHGSRQNLLEWTTAREAESRLAAGCWGHYQVMCPHLPRRLRRPRLEVSATPRGT